MLAMHSDIKQSNWASLLPLAQLAYNTSYSSTVHETPYFLMFGRQARLPVDIIMGLPHLGYEVDTHEFSKTTQENLQLAFELARRNLNERAEKQQIANSDATKYPVFRPGQRVLLFRPHATDGPNPKLQSPWRGPFVVRSQLSPVVYRVRPDSRSAEVSDVSVHLAHLKPYHSPSRPPAPDFNLLGEMFLGKSIPLPALLSDDNSAPRIESYVVDRIAGPDRARGRPGPHNYLYRLRLRGYGASQDLIRRAHEVPQCREMIAAYRADNGLDTPQITSEQRTSKRGARPQITSEQPTPPRGVIQSRTKPKRGASST